MQNPWSSFSGLDFAVVSTGNAPSPAYNKISLENISPNSVAWFYMTIDDSFVSASKTEEKNTATKKDNAESSSTNKSTTGTVTNTLQTASSSPYSQKTERGTSTQSTSSGSSKSTGQTAPSYVQKSAARAESKKSSSSKSSQHSRGGPTSGIYIDITAPYGAFFNGTDISFEYFAGGKHFFAGFDMMFSFLNLSENYEIADDNSSGINQGTVDDIFMMDTNAILGVSFNLWILRPYIAAGLGYYISDVAGTFYGKYMEHEDPSGFSVECMTGLDITLKKFVIGGVYKLRWLSGSGFVDDFGISVGINW